MAELSDNVAVKDVKHVCTRKSRISSEGVSALKIFYMCSQSCTSIHESSLGGSV